MTDFNWYNPDSENMIVPDATLDGIILGDSDYVDNDRTDLSLDAGDETQIGFDDLPTVKERQNFAYQILQLQGFSSSNITQAQVNSIVNSSANIWDYPAYWPAKYGKISIPPASSRASSESQRQVRVPKGHKSYDPYEFLFTPINGSNPAKLPKAGFSLPLPPETFSPEYSSDPISYIGVDRVERTLPGPRTLSSLGLEGMFPYVLRTSLFKGPRPNYIPNYIKRTNYLVPKVLVRIFQTLSETSQPVQLTIRKTKNGKGDSTVGGLVDPIMLTITSFTYEEAFGHPGSYTFSLSMKQWRPIVPGKKRIPRHRLDPRNPLGTPTGAQGPGLAGQTGAPPRNPVTHRTPRLRPRTDSRPIPDTYTVRQGDTIYDISAKVFGTSVRAQEIYKLNEMQILNEAARRRVSAYPKGWVLFTGMVLNMPQQDTRDALS